MPSKGAKGLLDIGWACVSSAALGYPTHAPAEADYPEDVVRRTSFLAGGGHGWRISALVTPRPRPSKWRIVVITGAPSWSAYWAPFMAALPQDREMIVVDRPGFANSEPHGHVADIRTQAQALSPLLRGPPGQKLMLVGQSYGAAIATLMTAAEPRSVKSLVLLSGYFGEAGPTARMLLNVGSRTLPLIPRDLRNAVLEVRGQQSQLPAVREALSRLKTPLHVVHGDRDDFAPIEIAERLVAETRGRLPVRLERVAGGDHFINSGPADRLMLALEACIPPTQAWMRWPTAWRRGWPGFRPAPQPALT